MNHSARGYHSPRARAWRNVMVAAINAGIEQHLFGLEPEQNYWPGERHVFRFEIDGIPAIGYVGDAGWQELSIHAALWPTPEGEKWVECWNAYFLAGEVFVSGWLERQRGKWLQSSPELITCRRVRKETVAALKIEPTGYADTGRFIF